MKTIISLLVVLSVVVCFQASAATVFDGPHFVSYQRNNLVVRDSKTRVADRQFLLESAKAYPVLSLGQKIKKGEVTGIAITDSGDRGWSYLTFFNLSEPLEPLATFLVEKFKAKAITKLLTGKDSPAEAVKYSVKNCLLQ